MIERDGRLLSLNQTIAYKNTDLQFINFTENLLAHAKVKNENAILGKRDNQDFPWSPYADEYHQHDQDALSGINYSSLTPFRGAKHSGQVFVICSRSKCLLENGQPAVFISVVPLYGPEIMILLNKLLVIDPPSSNGSYFIDKKFSDINITQRESECLFYLLRGKTSKLIAKAMGISYRTVEFHIEKLKVKLGCSNKAELIAKAFQMGYASNLPNTVFESNCIKKNIEFL